MSKQFLSSHTHSKAHPTDIFSLAVTSGTLLSASGSSHILSHSLSNDDTNPYPLLQSLPPHHALGTHHIIASTDGNVAVSVGFAGEVHIWRFTNNDPPTWTHSSRLVDGTGPGEVWALAISSDGQYLAGSTFDGRVNVWELNESRSKIRSYDTKGSHGTALDISPDGTLTASGHASGGLYVFDNATSRLRHSCTSLLKPVRAVKFSPAGTLLAAAGDAGVVALYSVVGGEQVCVLRGHKAWVLSLDWSATGEHLLSGSFDGIVKVWETDRRECVATITRESGAAWCVKWLRNGKNGRGEGFVVAGEGGSIEFYREAAAR